MNKTIYLAAGGELDTGEEVYGEIIEDEEEYVEESCCRQGHGLGPKDTDCAPNFRKAWNKIRGMIGNKYPLVAHNAR